MRRAVTARSCALVAGGERPADPVHRGVPEQGPRQRLRAVSEPPRGRGPGRAGQRERQAGAEPRALPGLASLCRRRGSPRSFRVPRVRRS